MGRVGDVADLLMLGLLGGALYVGYKAYKDITGGGGGGTSGGGPSTLNLLMPWTAGTTGPAFGGSWSTISNWLNGLGAAATIPPSTTIVEPMTIIPVNTVLQPNRNSGIKLTQILQNAGATSQQRTYSTPSGPRTVTYGIKQLAKADEYQKSNLFSSGTTLLRTGLPYREARE